MIYFKRFESRKKGADLTKSYDISPLTNIPFIKIETTTLWRHQKFVYTIIVDQL